MHVRNGKSILQLSRFNRVLIAMFALVNVSCSMDAMIGEVITVNTSSLTGRIANYAANSNQASAQDATSCITPVVNLYKLDSSGQRISPPAATTGVDDAGVYTIDLHNAGFETEALKTSPMLIEVKGCSAGVFFRPVTGYAEQNVTMSSSLLGYIINTDFKAKLSMALQDNGAEVDNLMMILGSPDSMDKAYNVLLANTEASDKFTQIFGVAPSALLDAAPEVLSYSLPGSAQEKIALQLDADAAHWSSSYQLIYEWKLDSTTLGTTKSLSHVPSGNSQGNHSLTLVVGQNNGSGHVDTTKPNKSFAGAIQISNNVLPQAPSFTVTSPSIAAGQPVKTRALVLAINTGTAFANCDTFSSLLMTESASMPSASENFPIVCTTASSQSLNYTLASSGDGNKTLYLWAKDAGGVISTTPVSLTLGLDTVAPTVSITTQPLAQSKSSSQVIAFTGNDGSGTIDHFECKLDSGSWDACSSPASFASLTEGDHTVSVRAIDTAGNMSVADSKTWHIDLTAPTLTLSGPASITNSLSAAVTLSGADTGGSGVASYQCSLDGAAYATCTAVMNYVLAAGDHTFKARVYDGAGNVSTVQTLAWTIDTTPPTVTITSKPSLTTNSVTATFSFVGADTGGASISGYECALDAASYSACTTGKSYSSLADGSHTFKVRATDTAGNIGTATTYTWTVNTVTPMASITSAPDDITNQTTASFSFYATPPSGGSISSYQCNLDSAGWATCSSPKSYSGLTQGTHTFEVRSIDNLSNVSDITSYTWIIDTTNPTLTITDKPAADTNSATAQFKFTGADTGGASIEKYYCELDSAGYTECASPKNYTSLAEGSHTFNVKVMDTAGNTSAVQSYSWDIDLTAPTLTLLTKPASLTNQTTAAFTFSATDPSGGSIAGYECKIDGGTATSCTSGVSYSSLAAGAHSFEVSAIDAAGNYSAAVSYSWTIDLTPPTVTITAKPSANSNSATAVFGFTGMDTGGGSVAGFKCKLDSGSYSTCASGGSYSSLAEGSHTVSIYASDTAGNDGTPVTYTWTVDTVAPTVTITTPSTDNYVIPSANLSAVTISGACSEEGVAVSLSGVTAAPTLCSSGSWTITANMSSLADGPYTLTASQTDTAGNAGSSAGRPVIKDATAPTITVTTPGVVKGGGTITATWLNTEANVAVSSSFAVELYDGTSWTSAGSKSATAGNNSNVTYSLAGISVPVTNTNAAKVRVTLTDAAGNSKTVTSSTFAIDSSAPTLSSFTVNGGASTTTNNNVLIGFNGADTLSNISKICMSTSSTAPTSSSSCWVPVGSYGLTAAKTLSTSSIYYNVGFVSGTYTIYIWLMDAVGNMSTNSSTASVDKGSVYYNSPNPPSVASIQLTSTDTPNSPPSGTDLIVSSGSAVYLKWNVSSSTGLAASPISVSYTTDDATTAGTLATGLSNSANGGCTVTAGFTGCAVLTAPVGTYFRLKMKITDSLGFFTTISSNPLNSGKINFLAGNTDLGLNSSAKSAIVSPSGINALQVLDDGRIFIVDTRGLAWVNPANGVYEILATYATTASGDGGELTSAKFKSINGIWKDSNNDILVADYLSIRRINTRVSPMTVSRIIGGGTDTSSYVATATNYKASTSVRHLSVSSNGDIYFTGENGHKVRKYTASTGAVSLITLTGTGNSSSSTQDNAVCGFSDYFVTFDSSGNTDKMIWVVSSLGSSSACPITSTTEGRAYAQVDPTTGIAMTPIPSRIATTDGYREYVNLYNDRSGNVFSAYNDGTPAQGIWKFNTSTLAWARVWGNDQYGTCADGTMNSSCAINTVALTFNSQGQPFYIDAKSKAVRTIDNDGYVRTVAGDKLGSDDGKMSLVTRFNNLTDVKSWNSSGTSYITVYDFGDVRVREFVPGSSIATLAGLQYSKSPSAGNVAATSPIHNSFDMSPTRILVNTNGDVFMPRAQGVTGRIVRSTGLWESWSSVGSYGPQPIGIYGNTMILNGYSYNGTINRMTDSRYFWVDLTTKTFTKKLYDTNGGSTQIPTTICADGSTLNGGCSLTAGSNDGGLQGQYDPGTTSWLMAEPNATRIAKFAYDGSGTMSTLFTAPRAFSRFAVNRSSDLTTNYIYTCATTGILYKYDLNNAGAESVIAFPNTTFTCEGAVHYDSYRNTLLFIYKQNGLKGVAEVVSP